MTALHIGDEYLGPVGRSCRCGGRSFPGDEYLTFRGETCSGGSRASPGGKFPRHGEESRSETCFASGHISRNRCDDNDHPPPSDDVLQIREDAVDAGSGKAIMGEIHDWYPAGPFGSYSSGSHFSDSIPLGSGSSVLDSSGLYSSGSYSDVSESHSGSESLVYLRVKPHWVLILRFGLLQRDDAYEYSFAVCSSNCPRHCLPSLQLQVMFLHPRLVLRPFLVTSSIRESWCLWQPFFLLTCVGKSKADSWARMLHVI